MNRFLMIIFIGLFSECTSNYYGLDGFGKLILSKDSLYYLDYFDNGFDTGFYRKEGNKIIFSSRCQPIKLVNYNDSNFLPEGLSINVTVYDRLNEKLYDTIAIYNDSMQGFFTICDLKENQSLKFDFFFGYRYIIKEDIKGKLFFKLDSLGNRRVYFDNYQMLIDGKYMLPIYRDYNDQFRKLNGFNFLILKKGRKNKKYEVYKSGFSTVN